MTVETERLRLRPWELSDAPDAFAIFDAPLVTRWLGSAAPRIPDVAAMRAHIVQWRQEAASSSDCVGHWAVLTRAGAEVVGALSLEYEPPGGESLTMGWALVPGAWGRGYAAEAGSALARWAIHEGGVPEVFAIVQLDNARAAATAQRIGMEWVTDLGPLARGSYHVFRIRHGDLGRED
jgi:RimJ/RimL family protein N-acetyltransferase